jgi:hypothetical protein
MSVSKFRLSLSAAVCAGALLISTGAAGASGPSATAKPSTGLKNGRVVTVKWAGFGAAKSAFVAVVECNNNVATDGQAACDTADAVIQPAAAKGSAKLTVKTGAIGTDGGTCGTSSDDASNCLIAVSGLNKKLGPVKNQNAVVPITFAVKG